MRGWWVDFGCVGSLPGGAACKTLCKIMIKQNTVDEKLAFDEKKSYYRVIVRVQRKQYLIVLLKDVPALNFDGEGNLKGKNINKMSDIK